MGTETQGNLTSEYAVTKSAQVWGKVAVLLGTVIAIATPFISDGSKIGVIAGAVVAIAGALQQTLVSLGYTKSRTEIKTLSK